jgi:hypothetical protein
MAALHLPFAAFSQADSHRAGAGREARVREATGACGFDGWSAPAVLNGLPPGALPRTPALAAGERQTFVVGQDWTLPDGGPLPPNPLIALGPSGSIGVPRGRFAFYSPKAVLDAAGTLHVLWAEPEHPDSARRTRRDPELTSLWYASYSHRRWSPAEKVYTTPGRLMWVADLEKLVVDSAGRLHATVFEWPRQAGVIVLTRKDRRWTTSYVPATSRAFYGSLAVGREGNLYLAYIALDTTVRRDAGSVFLTRSTDGGKTWAPAVQVSRSGQTQATSVRTLVAPDGRVHLVWGQNLSGGLVAEVLRHVASADSGRSWTRPSDLPIVPGFRSDLRAAMDGCGVVHVTYHDEHPPPNPGDQPIGTGELRYARWDGAWREADSPFPHLSVIYSDLARGPNGRVHLFLMGRPATDQTIRINFVPMLFTIRTTLHPDR